VLLAFLRLEPRLLPLLLSLFELRAPQARSDQSKHATLNVARHILSDMNAFLIPRSAVLAKVLTPQTAVQLEAIFSAVDRLRLLFVYLRAIGGFASSCVLWRFPPMRLPEQMIFPKLLLFVLTIFFSKFVFL